jgi:hypothetical protein
VAADFTEPCEGGDMTNKYWFTENQNDEEPAEADNFLMGQLLTTRKSKRQNTADHVAISYWKQEEITAPEEVTPVAEEIITPRSQYTDRVLQGLLVSNRELDELTEADANLEMESFASILTVSAKQKFVNHAFLNSVIERAETEQTIEEYYDEFEDDSWSPNTVRAA